MKQTMILETAHRLLMCILQLVLINAHVLAATGESIELGPNRGRRIVLHHSVSEQLQFDKTEWLWRFVIFQGHSQKEKTSLSTDAHFSYGYTDVGSNVGVLSRLGLSPLNYVFLRSDNSTKDINVDVIAVPYKRGAPLPGGCCLTCSMEFDPKIIVSYTAAETKVMFSVANVYFPKNGSSEGPPCDGNKKHGKKPEHFRLEYHIYQMFLKEGDLSEETYFKGIEKMAYPAVIKANAKKVTTVKTPNTPVVKFDTQQVGQGVVFNIIVYDPSTKMEAAYLPAVTYACSLNSKVDACHSPMKDVIVTGVFAVLGAVVSLVLCFTGFRFFQFTLFVGGLVNFSFVFFIIVTANSDISHLGRMLISFGCGVIFGLLVLALWWFSQWTRFCLFIDALFLGFLVGATIFFTPFGGLDVFQKSEFDYAAVLCCCTIIFPVVLILWPRLLCIAYTSIVSGYGFVVGIGIFLHSSLSYIVLDVVIRATEAQYRLDHVYVTRPFQRNDYYLSGTWIFLSVVGCIVQYVLSRDRPYFPRSGFVEQKKIRKYLSNKRTDERTPLLINSKQGGEGGANGIC